MSRLSSDIALAIAAVLFFALILAGCQTADDPAAAPAPSHSLADRVTPEPAPQCLPPGQLLPAFAGAKGVAVEVVGSVRLNPGTASQFAKAFPGWTFESGNIIIFTRAVALAPGRNPELRPTLGDYVLFRAYSEKCIDGQFSGWLPPEVGHALLYGKTGELPV